MAGEWMAQLSDDLKANEALAPYRDGDLSAFANAHIETLGKVTELDGSNKELSGKMTDMEGRLANSIPKLGSKPTDDEITAFRTALGVPEKAEDYEFPEIEGRPNDDGMMSWARDVFHKIGLPKEMAYQLGGEWNSFLLGMEKAEEEETRKSLEEASGKLKEDWGADFDKNMEFTRRAFQFFEEKLPGFKDLLEGVVIDDMRLGNHPIMLKVFHFLGQAMGEDFTEKGSPGKGKGEPSIGMNYEGMDHFK